MTLIPSPDRARTRVLGGLVAASIAIGSLTVAPLSASAEAVATATGRVPSLTAGPQSDDYFIGANYFSGWRSGDNFHFEYLDGTDWRPDHPELEPKYGWYDDTQAVIDEQIVDASANGLDYFVFDWYPERPTINDGGTIGGLHTGMELFRTSPEKSRMQFMINYIDGGPFNIGALRTPGMTQAQFEVARAAEWDTITDAWVELFQDPAYVKIDGKPVIEIYDVQRFTTDFSTGTRPGLDAHQLAQVPEERAVMQAAVDELTDKALVAGFDDVIIGGGLQQPGFDGEYVSAHDYDGLYDFFTAYAWHDMKRVPAAENSYDNLIRDNHDYVWDYFAKYKDPASDYVPVVSQGWDNIVHPEYNSWALDKTPEAFGNYLREAKAYLDAHPQTQLSPGSTIKMAIIGSWNELFEGHYFLPTKADGDDYTSQVGRVFGTGDDDGTVLARAANLSASIDSIVDAADELRADAPVGSPEEAELIAVSAAGTDLVSDLAEPHADTVRADIHTLDNDVSAFRGLTTSAELPPELTAALDADRAALVLAVYGLRATVAASDYSVTKGQSIDVAVDIEGSSSVASVVGELLFPSTWPAATESISGQHWTTSLAVPSTVADGRLYPVSDMFSGPTPMTGNRQQLEVQYSLVVDGITVSSRMPLPLTVIPDLASRTVRTGFDGTTNSHTFWLHNQTHTTLTGVLEIESVPGVTASATTVPVTLAPDQRLGTAVTFVNNTGEDRAIGATFTSTQSIAIGDAFVSPVETTVVTVGSLDGTLRSDSPAEMSNTNGRLQVGNAARPDGTNTEYRPIISFTLADLGPDEVSRVVLDVTEFEAGSPSDVVIEHLAPSASPGAVPFASAATDAVPFPITGAPPALGAHRQVDVTEWVLADLAAGASHSTFRLRLATVAPGTTSYRAFRPTEYTSADPSDAPQLKVVYTPSSLESVTTTGALDGAIRSDGIMEVSNSNGRLQVGNVARTDGTNTEYRVVSSFAIAGVDATALSRVTLDLTEFESGGSSTIVLEHLTPAGAVTAGQFASTPSAAKTFTISGTPVASPTHRQIDVTEWVASDLAAGASHSTFRLRLDTVTAGITSYRAFRPSEWASTDTTVTPRLIVRSLLSY